MGRGRGVGGGVCQKGNERIDDEALETRSNNNYGEGGAKKAPIWYAKDVCSDKSTRKTLGRLDLDSWT